MYRKFFYLLFTAVMTLSACQGKVAVNAASYRPQIVVQGTLVPGQLAQVKIGRNFPLNAPVIDPADIPIPDARATISDAAGADYSLTYNPQTNAYEAAQLKVDYGKTYTLNVDATVDGHPLQTSATTTVPNAGLRIIEEQSRLGSMPYRELDSQGNVINFMVAFERSPGTGYYLVSIVAIDPDTSNYIYDNPFNDNTAQDVLDDFEEYKYNYYWIQDRPLTPGVSSTEILSLYTYFYCRYRVIIYAADRNFRDFQSTHETLQGIDGNYHEGAFHLDGEGVGVFGSAAVDTAYFEVTRP